MCDEEREKRVERERRLEEIREERREERREQVWVFVAMSEANRKEGSDKE